MLTEVQDRDAIVSSAIEIASAEARAAYIAGACRNDPALRRQVEERVASHFQGQAREKRTHAAQLDSTPEAMEVRKMGQKNQRGMMTVFALVLLPATVGGAGWTMWKMRTEGSEQKSVQQLQDERDQARSSEALVKKQLEKVLASRKQVTEERDRAVSAEKEAGRSQEDAKAVLAFLQNNVLSASGRPTSWSHEGLGDKVTLRQAVDTAASKVAGAYPDRPLVEASIREVLGATYLDLGEAMKAVKQYERALALREAMSGPDDTATGDCRNKLAIAYRLADRTAQASHLFDQDPNSTGHAAALAIQGSTLLSQKKPAEAEMKLRAALAIRQKTQPDDWTTFDTLTMLGETLLEQKKFAEAEPLLLSGYDGLKQRESKIPSQDKVHVTKALERLVRLYEAWGKKDNLARWRKELGTTETPNQS